MKARPAVIAYIFLGIGGLLLVIGTVVAVLSNQASAARNETASGHIVGVEEKISRSRASNGTARTTTTFCPVVSYQIDGRPYRLEASVCGSSHPDLGSTMHVRYNPANPGDAELDTWLQRWLGPLILGGIGLVFTAIGAGFTIAVHSGRVTARSGSSSTEVPPGVDGGRIP